MAPNGDREPPKKGRVLVRRFVGRLSTVPFQSAIAGLVLLSGALALITGPRDPVDLVLPHSFVLVLDWLYLLSGLLILVGLGLGRAVLEGPGLVLLVTAIIVRFVGILGHGGWSEPVGELLLFYAVLLWACWVRLRSLLRGEIVVRGKVAE